MRKLAIAHRGASAYKSENTLEAFSLALEQGADMVEFDVRRNRVGEYVLSHSLPGSESATVCTLAEALERLRGKIRLDIELKERGYEREVVEFVLARLSPHEFVVSSFIPETVKAVKEQFPEVLTGLVLGPEGWRNMLRMAMFPLFPKKFIEVGDFLVLHKSLYALNPIDKFAWFTNPVYVWTVDDEKSLEKIAKDERVSGIISNRPDVCKRIIMENLE